MKIVFCAAEAMPFAKVGGLGDVVGSLPKALADLGHDVCVVLPRYGLIDKEDYVMTDTGIRFPVVLHGSAYPVSILEGVLPGSQVPVYFVEQHTLFGQYPTVYLSGEAELENLRFTVFCLAAFEWMKAVGDPVDVLHIHDWHTAKMAGLLKRRFKELPCLSQTGCVLTLHNLAYQGIWNGINPLADGMEQADAIVAVSPTYALEIQHAPGGAGLEDVIHANASKLRGILNGIDTQLFNPQTDRFIPKPYSCETFIEGKGAAKEALQREMGLPVNPNVPVFGWVSRLVEQKGMSLFLSVAQMLSELPAQFVVVGSGDVGYEVAMRQMNGLFENIRCRVGFNLGLGQMVYAGADAFLMPSLFEPCGLGQLIALRYGTVPIGRKTGGLADTIVPLDSAARTGTGFLFEDYHPDAFLNAIRQAISVYTQTPTEWQHMVERGMKADYSWSQSARAYEAVYTQISQKER